jgi:hypothetical protein
MEHVFSALHQGNPGRLPCQLEYGCHDQAVGLFWRFPPTLRTIIEGQMAAAYPHATIDRLPDDALEPATGIQTWSVELRLVPDLFPMRRGSEFEDALNRNMVDPLAGILNVLTPDKRERFQSRITLSLRPANAWRCRQVKKSVKRLDRPFFRAHDTSAEWYAWLVTHPRRSFRFLGYTFGLIARRSEQGSSAELSTSASRNHDRETVLHAAGTKAGQHLFECRLRLSVSADAKHEQLARTKLTEMIGAFGPFTAPRLATFALAKSHVWRSICKIAD